MAPTTPQIMMTLAAAAYDDTPQDTLNNTNLATGGDWTVVWGPVFDVFHYDNSFFIAQQTGTDAYAFVIRGTKADNPISWFQDYPQSVHEFTDQTGGQPTYVEHKFWKGLQHVLTFKSGPGDTTAMDYLNSIAPEQLYVAGHSQGAALVPIAIVALLNGLTCSPDIAGYAFAQPSPGDTAFSHWMAHTAPKSNATCAVFQNPNDIVPYAYGRLTEIVSKGIPKNPATWEADLIDELNSHVQSVIRQAGPKAAWAPAGEVTWLDGKASSGLWTSQVAEQHHVNTYLTLLGANEVCNGTYSTVGGRSGDPPAYCTGC